MRCFSLHTRDRAVQGQLDEQLAAAEQLAQERDAAAAERDSLAAEKERLVPALEEARWQGRKLEKKLQEIQADKGEDAEVGAGGGAAAERLAVGGLA